jgi:hypothetical protein
LPIELNLSRWGKEGYREIPLVLGEENSQIDCNIGDIGYWSAGRGFCIFWGPTPVSNGEKLRVASPVNIFAKIEGDPTIFNRFQSFKGVVRKAD